MNSIIKANKEKYKQPPSIETMRQKAEEEGMSLRSFATHYGISSSVFRMVVAGMRQLPSQYWHLFYEKEPNMSVSPQIIEKQPVFNGESATICQKHDSIIHNRLSSLLS